MSVQYEGWFGGGLQGCMHCLITGEQIQYERKVLRESSFVYVCHKTQQYVNCAEGGRKKKEGYARVKFFGRLSYHRPR